MEYTRETIEKEYRTENGRIVECGKFEGEAVWVPYFWELGLEGSYDETGEDFDVFDLTDENKREFPELANCSQVILTYSDSGFVSGRAE